MRFPAWMATGFLMPLLWGADDPKKNKEKIKPPVLSPLEQYVH